MRKSLDKAMLDHTPRPNRGSTGWATMVSTAFAMVALAIVGAGCTRSSSRAPDVSMPSDSPTTSSSRIDVIARSWRTWVIGNILSTDEDAPRSTIPESQSFFFRFDPMSADARYVAFRTPAYRSLGPALVQFHIYPSPPGQAFVSPYVAHVRDLQQRGVETSLDSVLIDGQHYRMFAEPGAEEYFHIIAFENGMTIHAVAVGNPRESPEVADLVTQVRHNLQVLR